MKLEKLFSEIFETSLITGHLKRRKDKKITKCPILYF